MYSITDDDIETAGDKLLLVKSEQFDLEWGSGLTSWDWNKRIHYFNKVIIFEPFNLSH